VGILRGRRTGPELVGFLWGRGAQEPATPEADCQSAEIEKTVPLLGRVP
jgi:hypothetical protein